MICRKPWRLMAECLVLFVRHTMTDWNVSPVASDPQKDIANYSPCSKLFEGLGLSHVKTLLSLTKSIEK